MAPGEDPPVLMDDAIVKDQEPFSLFPKKGDGRQSELDHDEGMRFVGKPNRVPASAGKSPRYADRAKAG
jgi:hypothetical protein